MILSEEYLDFILQIPMEYTGTEGVSEVLIKIQEELGEASEAWLAVIGITPRKQGQFREVDVAKELADVVHAALVGIAKLGFDPNDLLWDQKVKVERRRSGASA